jgi:hypothetical protein
MARDPRSVVAQGLIMAGYSHEYAEKMVRAALDAHAHELAEDMRRVAEQWDSDALKLYANDVLDPKEK